MKKRTLLLLVLISVTTLASARLYTVAGLGQIELDVERDLTCFQQCRGALSDCKSDPNTELEMCYVGYADCIDICLTN